MISPEVTSSQSAKAVLVTVKTPEHDNSLVQDLRNELGELTRTLGAEVIDSILVRLKKPSPRYFIGAGNASDILRVCREKNANLLVFNNDLSPSQQRNLEVLGKIRVIDRHEVILDIFAARASTREAVLQIELAKTEYMLPRLKRAWTHLSRQQGGVGIRGGEGEKQIEVDERLVRRRISKLKNELAGVRKRRAEQRKKRQRKPVPNAAIVGYTNAGKSSLLNRLTNANSFVENKLFATLDPTTRRVSLDNNQVLLLTDTVGFVRHLPHDLVQAFKATLEEAVLADFLIQVIDITSPYWSHHIATTHKVLSEIGAGDKYTIKAFNKIDMIKEPYIISRIRRKYPDGVFISTKTGAGINKLSALVTETLNFGLKKMKLRIPVSKYDLVALLHRTCDVKSQYLDNESICLTVSVPDKFKRELEEFVIN